MMDKLECDRLDSPTEKIIYTFMYDNPLYRYLCLENGRYGRDNNSGIVFKDWIRVMESWEYWSRW